MSSIMYCHCNNYPVHRRGSKGCIHYRDVANE